MLKTDMLVLKDKENAYDSLSQKYRISLKAKLDLEM